ncbi:unnamed protein product, partial [Lepidochelys kempii]
PRRSMPAWPEENESSATEAFMKRAEVNSLAALGKYEGSGDDAGAAGSPSTWLTMPTEPLARSPAGRSSPTDQPVPTLLRSISATSHPQLVL